MQVFLGSSRERLNELKELAKWTNDRGHKALPWNLPGLFPPGEYTFETLNRLKDKVDAAVLIFAEDDEIWYRGDLLGHPRDNVLIEYGLFAGVLESRRVCICRVGRPKTSVDLLGITYISLDDPGRGKLQFESWLDGVEKEGGKWQAARLLVYENKLSIPDTNAFWRSLSNEADKEFVLLGASNKSWIKRDRRQTQAMGESIVRILKDGGNCAILCADKRRVVQDHIVFVAEYVVDVIRELSGSDRDVAQEGYEKRFLLSVSSNLNYQAVISDDRIVVLPLLNAKEFKAESVVVQFNRYKHPPQFQVYYDDIKRIVNACEIRSELPLL